MPVWNELHPVKVKKPMRNIIGFVKEFIEANREHNLAAKRGWDEQRQDVYVRFNNIYSKSNSQQAAPVSENSENE